MPWFVVPPSGGGIVGFRLKAGRQTALALFCFSSAGAQTLVLDNFNAGSATGSILAGSSWVGNVTPNPTSITIGGTATDVNGWGATGLSLNASGVNFLTVTAQRDPGNTASTFAVQFEDRSLNTHVVSVSMSAFAVGMPTQVQVPVPAAPTGFSNSQITSWSLGGGGLGTDLLRLTLEFLALDTSLVPDATLAPMGTFIYSAQLTGTRGLTVNGPGTLILGAANSFSGDVVVAQGTLQLGATGALPSGAPVNLGSGATLNLAGFAATLGRLEGAGNITLAAANLTAAQSSNSTFSGVISGSGGLAKSGSGTLTLTGANTFSGATAITGGQIKLNGSAANSAFTVSGGRLSGAGTVGALTISSSGTLAPGNSPGTLAAGATTWAGGGNYEWELNSTAGTKGADPGWDWLNVTGALTITATGGTPYTIALTSLTTGNVAGNVIDFNSSANYSFTIATASGGIVGFDPGKFTINTTNFSNALNGGAWSLGVSGNDLNLNFTTSAIPEPSTCAAIAGALMLGVAAWRSRARNIPSSPGPG